MKMIAGAASLACWNRSRTREAPTPTIISTNSDADIWKNGTPASPATARASSVLPVPGGAAQQHAARDAAAEREVLVGVLEEVDDLGQLLLGLVDAGDVLEGDLLLGAPRRGGRASGRTTSARRRRRRPRPPAHDEHEQRDEQQRGAEAEDQAGSANDGPGVGRLGVDRHALVAAAASNSDELSANDGTWVEKSSSMAFSSSGRVLDRLLERALDRVAGRGDLLDVVGLDLVRNVRAVRDPDRRVGLERLRGDPQVERQQQHDHQPRDPPARTLRRRRALRRAAGAAAVRGRRDPPARLAGGSGGCGSAAAGRSGGGRG